MKITRIEHIQREDLVEDDFYLIGHQSADAIQANIDTGSLAIMLMTNQKKSGDGGEVTRITIDRRNWTHGLRSTYGAGCRCPSCTLAQREYMRGYSSDRRAEARESAEEERVVT